MPLSEHEQRMLDQIERALYAEDPKFASTVRGGRVRRPSKRRRLQGIVVFTLGLVLLLVGVAIPFDPARIPVGVVGFLVMFTGGMIVVSALRGGSQDAEAETGEETGGSTDGNVRSSRPEVRGRGSSFTQRMEERFRKRFDQ